MAMAKGEIRCEEREVIVSPLRPCARGSFVIDAILHMVILTPGACIAVRLTCICSAGIVARHRQQHRLTNAAKPVSPFPSSPLFPTSSTKFHLPASQDLLEPPIFADVQAGLVEQTFCKITIPKLDAGTPACA